MCTLFLSNEEYKRIIDSFKNWIYWSDIIDNAKYGDPSQVVELKYPCLQIDATITNDIEDSYLQHLVTAAKMYPPEEVVQAQIVKSKIENILKVPKEHISIFKNGYKAINNEIILFDYVQHGIPFQRYMTYYFKPQTLYSIGIYRRSGNFAISVGKNPWMEFPSKNIGEICQTFGGGGRINVGSILINDYNKALTMINTICDLLSN